jgi:taspase (threonine aspartase 1)
MQVFVLQQSSSAIPFYCRRAEAENLSNVKKTKIFTQSVMEDDQDCVMDTVGVVCILDKRARFVT